MGSHCKSGSLRRGVLGTPGYRRIRRVRACDRGQLRNFSRRRGVDRGSSPEGAVVMHVPEAGVDAWPCWRLVCVEKLATWTEVNESMSIDDVFTMLEVCDAAAVAEAKAANT